MAHKHSVYDTDAHFQIDGVTRAVKNASSAKTTLVQHDHNSERFTFEIPRMVDGHDMSLCNVVQVHYLNIDNQTKEQKSGVYGVDDLDVSPEGDDVVICSWLVSGNATQLVGNLSFIVRFMCVSDDGTVDYVWNTAVHSGVSVSTGIYNGDVIAEEYADIVAQWEARIQKCEDRAETAINTANGYQEQIDAINTAATFASQTSQKANAKASEAKTTADEAKDMANEAYNHAVTNFTILRDEIGDIDNLETEDKSSLVSAINALAKSGGSGGVLAANVTQTDTGAVITITDKDGETTATIANGADGYNVLYYPYITFATDGENTFQNDKLTTTPKVGDLVIDQGGAMHKVTAVAETTCAVVNICSLNGKNGYTPARGTDYWTDADKAEIKAYVDEAILGGAW